MSASKAVIGLTGGIGCGKSTVSDLFAGLGVEIVDADRIAHALTVPGGAAIPALRRAFGETYIGADGALDRTAMRELVFADADAKKTLEAILHPMIRVESDRAIAGANSAYVVAVIPLLFESGRWKDRVARALVVDCPVEVQIERVMLRSKLSRAAVEAIMHRQVSRADRLALADDIIENGDSPKSLPPRVEALHRYYLEIAST